MTHDHLKAFIDSAYEHAVEITPETKGVVRDAVSEVLDLLDKGELRVAEKRDGGWLVHQWLKKAILLSFRLNEPHKIDGDRKSTRLNSSHLGISYAVFCLKKKKQVTNEKIKQSNM